MKPRLLDLFCGAGGCTKGYQEAGFYVVGVDIEPQPNYCGDEFVQADVMRAISWFGIDAEQYDAIHASPPCPAYSLATHYHGTQENHPDLVGPVRELLRKTGLPYVIENVMGAPLRKDLVLCGEMFGLGVHRHRIFEIEGFFAMQPPHSLHLLKGAEHNCDTREGHARLVAGNYADHEGASEAMGIDWMERDELRNAIPPAHTKHIGEYLLAHLKAEPPPAKGGIDE